MSKTSLQQKLRLQAGQKALIINPPQDYASILGSEPEGIKFAGSESADLDFVHLFVHDRAELDNHIDAALGSVKYDSLLWISYPKGSSKIETDLNRDILWELLLEKGIRPVMQISIDETWSAVRFRPIEKIGK